MQELASSTEQRAGSHEPLSTINHHLSTAFSERLNASDWSLILDVSERHVRRCCGSGDISRAVLPAEWQAKLGERMVEHSARSVRDLVEMLRIAKPAWTPPRPFSSYPPDTQARALKTREALAVYYEQRGRGVPSSKAEQAAATAYQYLTGKPWSTRTVRNWLTRIEERGGFERARMEAFCDDKSCPHHNQRLSAKVPRELAEEFRAVCTQTQRVTDAYRKLDIDWRMGREVPGIGYRSSPDEPFPFTVAQLRQFAPSNAARVLGHLGKARARAACLPHVETTTAHLRRAEIYMLDDTRLDIIALDDLTGRPVELKCYIMQDLASRRIEGWTVVEGSIQARHVEALVARVMRSCGVGKHYPTTIVFERGTVACSPARQTFLESCFQGRLIISRTSMDGGKNHGGDFGQARSGHWMGKGHMESLVRTFVFFAGHLPGQRGNKYENQPAALGLVGRNRATGALEYTRGSRMNDAALLAGAGRAIEYLENGLEERIAAHAMDRCQQHGERLRFNSLHPVSWILAHLTEAVAYYNARTDHRIEGFRRIEWQDERGALRWRMESPNERAAWLSAQSATERLSAADAAIIIRTHAQPVTVTRQGVSFTLDKTSFRFFSPDSLAVAEAIRLSTGDKKYVAIFDREGLLQGTASEIHLLTETAGVLGRPWKPGDPARYLETLPLCDRADRTKPEELATALENAKRVEQRIASELVRAAAPIVAERLANAQANITDLREARDIVTTSIRSDAAQLHSDLSTINPQLSTRGEAACPTRLDERDAAAARLANLLAE